MNAQNIERVREPVTWGTSTGREQAIWSIYVISPGLVYKCFLIDPPEHLNLVLYGLLRYFPIKQETQGRSFLIFMIFLSIIPVLDILMRNLKYQWFRLWCQTSIPLSSRSKSSSIDHRLAISSLMRLAPTAYFLPPPSWWVFVMGSRSELEGLLLPPSSHLGPKFGFTRCLPREPPWCAPLEL